MESRFESRQNKRWKTNQTVELRLLGEQQLCISAIVIDASEKGLRVSGAGNLRPKTTFMLQLGEQMLLGEVIWCANGEAGLELEEYLDLETAKMLRQNLLSS